MYNQMNNYGQQMNFVQPKTKVNMGTFLTPLIIACVVLVIGCFMDFFKVGELSTNYISYEGEMKDGVYVLGAIAIGLICVFKNKCLGGVIGAIVADGIVLLDYMDMQDKISEANQYLAFLGDEYKAKLGIGFYIVVIALAAITFIMIKLFLMNKNTATPVNYGNQNMNYQQPVQQPQMQQMQNVTPMAPGANVQPVQQVAACPYCGTPKGNTPFCPNCGAKF